MKKKSFQTLKLNKETISNLTIPEMQEVHGGVVTVDMGDSRASCAVSAEIACPTDG
jgi:hypothetical protein